MSSTNILSGTFRNPQPLYFLKSIAGTNGRRAAVQIGGVLRYKLGVYCGVSLSPKFRIQQGTALQMGGVLRYKLEVYCLYFSDKLYGSGVPEQCPHFWVYVISSASTVLDRKSCTHTMIGPGLLCSTGPGSGGRLLLEHLQTANNRLISHMSPAWSLRWAKSPIANRYSSAKTERSRMHRRADFWSNF